MRELDSHIQNDQTDELETEEENSRPPPPLPQRDASDAQDLTNEYADELKSQILNHIGDNRISQLISFMLESMIQKSGNQIPSEVVDVRKDKIKGALFFKISDMLEDLFTNDLDEWLCLLMIDDPANEQIVYFDELRLLITNISKLKDKITLDNIDDIAKMILQTKELKQELGKLVATLIAQVNEQA